jgi:hypothetical protein
METFFFRFSKFSLKAVLPHNGNIHPSILMAQRVHRKERNMQGYGFDLLLKGLNYSQYGWKICGDLKVIGLLLGIQSGYTRYSFFFLNETAEQKTNITKLRIGPCRKTQFQRKSVSEINY